LLLACPLFAGFTAYSYIADRYIWHVAPKSFAESAGSVTGSILIFLVFGAVAGISDWKKLQKEVGVQR